MEKMMQEETKFKLSDSVITLHDIARLIELEVGKGNLSDDIRQCANRLNVLVKDRNVTL
jgi:hypothetical protein